MTWELIGGAVVVLISVALRIVPSLAEKWATLRSDTKFIIIALLCIILPFVASGLYCLGVDVGLEASCPSTAQDIFDLALVGFAAFYLTQWADRWLKPDP